MVTFCSENITEYVIIDERAQVVISILTLEKKQEYVQGIYVFHHQYIDTRVG